MWISPSSRHRLDPDFSPCGVLMFDDEGRLEVVNGTLREWLGLEPAMLEGLSLDDLLAPPARVMLHMALMPLLKLRGRADEITLILRPREGDDVHVIASAVRRQTAEGPVCHAVFTRIDERRKLEEELARSRRVSDEMPGVIFQLEVAREGTMRFTHVGEGVHRLFGLTAEAVRRDAGALFERLHADDRPQLMAAMARTGLPGGGHVDFRLKRPGSDDWTWCSAHATPRRLVDGSTLWNGYLADITVQRRLEESLRENHELRLTGMLAAGIAHDFNNLLGSINGLAELCLLEAAGQPRLVRNLERIRTGGQRAAALVRQMLDYSRQSPQVLQRVSLQGLLQRGRDAWEAALPPGVSLAVQAPDDVVACADPVQMEQALMHLVDNAGDAMRETGGVVRVLLEAVPANAPSQPLKVDAARLVVEDTGTGIAPEHLPDIFQPFFTTKEVGQGTGLGLSAVHGIVTSHGGRVEVESRPGEGSRFALWIPLSPPTAPARPAPGGAQGLSGRP